MNIDVLNFPFHLSNIDPKPDSPSPSPPPSPGPNSPSSWNRKSDQPDSPSPSPPPSPGPNSPSSWQPKSPSPSPPPSPGPNSPSSWEILRSIVLRFGEEFNTNHIYSTKIPLNPLAGVLTCY
ncbi:hypothetical protein DE146DRAFT_760090 [Phaeosphaeria sp. MPI-PUGE-AT-0046c]|nr:hypothetical protein DE146DRAFT_760090 [Phaeosphaeria sp. MPI-PUGE-AT-0046c]